MPVTCLGPITQYVGRWHSLPTGKREVRVYDCADLHLAMLECIFDHCCPD